MAPNFKLKTIEGNEVELTSLKGKGVVVNFWASWCQPCLNEMPEIQKAYEFYKDSGIEVLAVNVGESLETVNKFLEENSYIDFTILMENESITGNFSIHALPTTFFINSEGNIENYYFGELNLEQLHVFIKDIIPSK